MREDNIRQIREALHEADTSPLQGNAHMVCNIPPMEDPWQPDVLSTQVVADRSDLFLGVFDNQATDLVLDSVERIVITLPAILVITELPASISCAAAVLLLLPAHGADIVHTGTAACVVNRHVHVVVVAVVLEEVVGASLNQGVQFVGCSGTVAHGAVEGVSKSG